VLDNLGTVGWKCFSVLAHHMIANPKEKGGLTFDSWFNKCENRGILANKEVCLGFEG